MKTATTPTADRSRSATENTCRLCAPLGACLAFRGIEGAMPLLHGSQGCATYIRRYMISHFREPIDIASTSFSEESAVFGGRENLRVGLANVIRQYEPRLIGIAGTCLAETIGDDVAMFLREIVAERSMPLPELVHVSTPSYCDSYEDGYRAATAAIIQALANGGPRHQAVNLIAPLVSPADLRELKAAFAARGIETILAPDFSDTLDGPTWSEYHRIPPGGTPLEAIRRMGGSRLTIEFADGGSGPTAGTFLREQFGVPLCVLPLPIGIEAVDQLGELLDQLSGLPAPAEWTDRRGRLIDSYIDAHKYIFGKRVAVCGGRELVAAIAGFLAEIGMKPVLCATGAKGMALPKSLFGPAGNRTEHTAGSGANADSRELFVAEFTDSADEQNLPLVCDDTDFAAIEEQALRLRPDLIVGSSKAYALARRLNVPLVRAGFPIHDRIDGPRLLHLGYGGTQQLFDRIVNALIEKAQESSPIGYSYM